MSDSDDRVQIEITRGQLDALVELVGGEPERDERLQQDARAAGFAEGHATGVEAGRELEGAERDEAWHRIAAPIAKGGPSHDELEERRWGPGGREHFADPRPGDFEGFWVRQRRREPERDIEAGA